MGVEEGKGDMETSEELELHEDEGEDLEAAMREAVAAIEQVEKSKPAGPPEEDKLSPAVQEEFGQLKEELARLRDQSIRTLADFDNYRKRIEREKKELKRFALVDPMRDFLQVVDNLERAVSAAGSIDDLKEGVEMILRQMRELLSRFEVRELETDSVEFDPAIHEAVSRHEDPSMEVPTVIEELQRGYTIHERLLRPAMVRVAVPADAVSEGNGEPEEEDPK
jgi:molecular chaperone GrpE